ncbi:iron ABC transporter [Sulfolobus sp. A20]|uniref:FecCD family ABC transporter permease n=1 Tax=Saccharolobus sp. A20 TaxID=1891280 RepID=UPI000845DB17|nr:iron ABC transporter permease [Sulfolobus sp. A20]TRM74273.1 iron ABC transporter permease [Sulfolobus sp. E5]TRM77842.1 iron ABC transporter permease [Sulfolobus sp. B5]TRM78558.1 iron ABC transporter permease [Sulfolobus sp. A20-N-F8]TRM86556.1 iron ABC transporter permease [Sulfolobus sp. C3]TRM92640.1 iron ABC transporter permease [Sulfolobus sp. A20-N-G8]TRM98200.1 iron ABC transporter permease [Sulfolobus sp. E1]TRN00695.1 iron ABC transporter permease [Sulfolobus sp. F1]
MNKFGFFSIFLLIFLTFLSLVYGEVKIPLHDIFSPRGVYSYILFNIRLPTIVATFSIGIILSVSGAILQMLLRNPLVDSYISGTASGGAFGAVLSYFFLVFNLPFSWIIYFQPFFAFITALLATFITVVIGRKTGILGLVIGGVLVSFIFSSLMTLLLSVLSIKYPQIPPLTFWLLGDISVVGWTNVIILLILSIILIYFSVKKSRLIDLVSISDEISFAHGINPSKERIIWLVIISLMVAYCVSVAGIIGFLGIIVPHIVRRLIGGNTRVLILYSSVLGSEILLISRLIAEGTFGYFIPLTAIMSIIGAPIMISALVKRNVSTEEH